jgi:hypothetical protein
MKKILSISIKFLLVFVMINNLFYYLRYTFYMNKMNIIIDLNYFLTDNFFIPFIIYILLWGLFWLFGNKISEKIIGNNDIYIEKINYNEIISIIIIVFGLYFLFNSIPELLENIIELIFFRINNSITYMNYSYIISSIISKIIQLIISLCLLFFRKRIINCFIKI